MQVWDEDDGYEESDDLMGTIVRVCNLQLEGSSFPRLDVQGCGKLYDFSMGFDYEIYIPGVSPTPPSTPGPLSPMRRKTRIKTVFQAAVHHGMAGAAMMHPLRLRLVRLTTSGAGGHSFDAYEFVSDVHGNRRAAERLAILAHPFGHGFRCGRDMRPPPRRLLHSSGWLGNESSVYGASGEGGRGGVLIILAGHTSSGALSCPLFPTGE